MKKALLTNLISASILLLSAKAFAGTAYYYATTNIFDNPERGFSELVSNAESFNFQSYPGYPVVRVFIRLDRFKTGGALDSCFISNLQNSFASARTVGVKVIPVFSYNYGPSSNVAPYTGCDHNETIQNDGQDASLSTILNHISQLNTTLNNYSDVIYEIHAGFIGYWGEWHNSTNGNDTVSAHHQVIAAEQSNFPSNRHIILRLPAYKMNYLGCPTCWGQQTQLGQHNEQFQDDSNAELFSDPQGTYNSTQCRTFYDNDVVFTANGADACSCDGLIHGDIAVNRMIQYHYSIMEADSALTSYWQANWQNDYITMRQKLGYRFQVTQATTPDTVTPAVTYTISVNLKNNGFAILNNLRAMYAVVIHPGGSVYVDQQPLRDSNGNGDLRNLTVGAETTYTANFTLPATFTTGTANTYLWLPDYSTGLQSNPKFSAQLDGVTWDSNLGANLLGLNTINVIDSTN